jgi:hypothetical protein
MYVCKNGTHTYWWFKNLNWGTEKADNNGSDTMYICYEDYVIFKREFQNFSIFQLKMIFSQKMHQFNEKLFIFSRDRDEVHVL